MQQFRDDVYPHMEKSQRLISFCERGSKDYQKINEDAREVLNKNPLRGFLKKIDVSFLKSHDSDLLGLYFHFVAPRRSAWDRNKAVSKQLYLDVHEIKKLKSQWKNPTILALRRVRKYLMSSHQKVLSRLTEAQSLTRLIDFTDFSIERSVKHNLEEMDFFQTNASLPGSHPRRLDTLCKALRLGLTERLKLIVLQDLITDEEDLRHKKARVWFDNSCYNGTEYLLKQAVQTQVHALEERAYKIIADMNALTDLTFDTDLDEIDLNFTWFSLGTSLPRGRAFVQTFGEGENVKNKIGRMKHTQLTTQWNSEGFKMAVEQHGDKEDHDAARKIATHFMDMETCIKESTGSNGLAHAAILAERSAGCMTSVEAEEALVWVRKNKRDLMKLRLKVLGDLRAKKEAGETAEDGLELPEYMEKLFKEEWGDEALQLPDIQSLKGEFQKISDPHQAEDYKMLTPLVGLHTKLNDEKKRLSNSNFQARYFPDIHLRTDLPEEAESSAEREIKVWQKEQEQTKKERQFDEMADQLMNTESVLEQMIVDTEEVILRTYRGSMFCVKPDNISDLDPALQESLPWIESDTYKKAFAVFLDHMLLRAKRLDYSPIQEPPFRAFFEKVQKREPQEKLFHLDRLFQELHAIPMGQQLLEALEDWEQDILPHEYDSKHSAILTCANELQELVNNVREELRDTVSKVTVVPKRLYFEIFELGDHYVGNLQGLLHGLLRLAPKLSSDKTGNSLISDIETLEARILEAQVDCASDGDAGQKLKILDKIPNSQQLAADLTALVQENFLALRDLLGEVNEGLLQVTELQNRFGGSHETDHLRYTIDTEDLKKLRETYNFVPNVSMMDVKRFAASYKHRETLISELFQNSLEKSTTIPKEVAVHISTRAFQEFKQKKKINQDLKHAMLNYIRKILVAEARQLSYTLNYVAPGHVSSKTIVKGMLEVLRICKVEQKLNTLTSLEFWISCKELLNDFKPKTHENNYQSNLKLFLKLAAHL